MSGSSRSRTSTWRNWPRAIWSCPTPSRPERLTSATRPMLAKSGVVFVNCWPQPTDGPQFPGPSKQAAATKPAPSSTATPAIHSGATDHATGHRHPAASIAEVVVRERQGRAGPARGAGGGGVPRTGGVTDLGPQLAVRGRRDRYRGGRASGAGDLRGQDAFQHALRQPARGDLPEQAGP